jgi:hypothetical protein
MSRHDQEQKRINQRFRALMDKRTRHLRVGILQRDDTWVSFVGMVRDLHGPDGVCTDCHGRTPTQTTRSFPWPRP